MPDATEEQAARGQDHRALRAFHRFHRRRPEGSSVTMLDVALDCVRRGWYVFPCQPKSKVPWTANGFKDASNDEAQIRLWWELKADANVGIATGPSGLTVLHVNNGLPDADALGRYCTARGLAETHTVRTGRRPGFCVQLYYRGEGLQSGPWVDPTYQHVSGDIRGSDGYVMAPGCVHPESGELYVVMCDAALAPLPEFVRSLKSLASNGAAAGTVSAVQNGGGKITSHRRVTPNAEAVPDRTIRDARESRNTEGAAEFQIGAKPSVGSMAMSAATKPSVDWRQRYMTEDAYLTVKQPEFLIDGFLARQSVTLLAGPASQRKSGIALNIAHSLCTRKPLFGHFHVHGGHQRVIYLAPEVGRLAFAKRLRDIGLGSYVAKTLFVQTMSEAQTALDDLNEELPGAVIIVDTISRYFEGNEDSSEHMRAFAARISRLTNAGATVVLLHHTKRESSASLDEDLQDSSLPASSELEVLLDSCWVAQQEDPKNPESPSLVRNTKQRDFEADPFKLRAAPGSSLLLIERRVEPRAVVKRKADDAALVELQKLLAVDPNMGINKICVGLRSVGNGRGPRWVKEARATLLSHGVTLIN